MAQNVFPTKNNLINTKKSLRLARVGYDLMDKKRNILVREIMQMMDDAKAIQSEIFVKYSEAYAALQLATVSLGVCDDVSRCVPIDDSLKVTTQSVNGVELPVLTLENRQRKIYYGLSSTNKELDDAYMKFNEVKELTVKLAQIESCIVRLAEAIKKTQKRTNALGNIMIPQFESTVKFISNALDEKEREDFSRLKVIKQTK